MILIDGKKLSQEILEDLKKEIAFLPFQPVFCDVLVGEDGVSAQYVRMKAQRAEAVGIKFHHANFPGSITTEGLIEEIKKLNKMPNMCGIIVQLPLPESLDRRQILDAIDPALDVDCLGASASNKFYSGNSELGFPTALACMALLDTLGLDLGEKNIVVMGQGELVGRPVTALLKHRDLSPIIVTSKTEDKEKILKEADVIISGIGKGRYITGEMLKLGVVVIDAGTSEEGSGPAVSGVKIVGDVDIESVQDVAGYVSPVPGGVGPVTVAMLLKNVLTVAKNLK